MVQDGTATLPELIGDRAIAFGLAATLGLLHKSVALPEKNYRKHLQAMPYRTSVFTTQHPKLLPPLTRRLNLDDEGGYSRRIQNVVKRGNLATYFQTQEVPHGQTFKGAIFGFDPFKETGRNELVIRIGLHRNGMVLLKPDDTVRGVCLNAATAALFQRELAVKRYCLHSLQLSPHYSLTEAWQEVNQWH
ncbi:MAG: hypothetical protein DRR19_12205 [Candidatus Parabeggiatoa sp. nov. 1]|nr:MAG: hypothetical protein DRR19_12205 [Gammaproteobacteria bacterium]